MRRPQQAVGVHHHPQVHRAQAGQVALRAHHHRPAAARLPHRVSAQEAAGLRHQAAHRRPQRLEAPPAALGAGAQGQPAAGARASGVGPGPALRANAAGCGRPRSAAPASGSPPAGRPGRRPTPRRAAPAAPGRRSGPRRAPRPSDPPPRPGPRAGLPGAAAPAPGAGPRWWAPPRTGPGGTAPRPSAATAGRGRAWWEWPDPSGPRRPSSTTTASARPATGHSATSRVPTSRRPGCCPASQAAVRAPPPSSAAAAPPAPRTTPAAPSARRPASATEGTTTRTLRPAASTGASQAGHLLGPGARRPAGSELPACPPAAAAADTSGSGENARLRHRGQRDFRPAAGQVGRRALAQQDGERRDVMHRRPAHHLEQAPVEHRQIAAAPEQGAQAGSGGLAHRHHVAPHPPSAQGDAHQRADFDLHPGGHLVGKAVVDGEGGQVGHHPGHAGRAQGVPRLLNSAIRSQRRAATRRLGRPLPGLQRAVGQDQGDLVGRRSRSPTRRR